MYNLFISSLLAASTLGFNPTSSEVVPTMSSFVSVEGVEVLYLEYEKSGSEVSITLQLQIDDSVLAVTSTSHNYVEATEQLNRVISDAKK